MLNTAQLNYYLDTVRHIHRALLPLLWESSKLAKLCFSSISRFLVLVVYKYSKYHWWNVYWDAVHLRYVQEIEQKNCISGSYDLKIISINIQIKSNQILFIVGNVHLKENKISKKLFTWLYSITNNNKLYIWFKYFGTSLWNRTWPLMKIYFSEL